MACEMALDKQKILYELGSVMNQLKNADCGCIGNLFGNSGQSAPSGAHNFQGCQGYRQSCPGWSHNMTSSEQCNSAHKKYPCGSRSSPPKLYADTFSYLNHNLVEPTIKEVYDELKSITPDNTVANNPIANQMGLIKPQSEIPTHNGQEFGGMGPQIMNMFNENNSCVNNSTPRIGTNELTNPPQLSQNAVPSIKYNNGENHQISANIQPHMPTQNNSNPYGQHAQSVAKFNEMFPSMSKNDLGYDPMTIALQMNPANQNITAKRPIQGTTNNFSNLNNINASTGQLKQLRQPIQYQQANTDGNTNNSVPLSTVHEETMPSHNNNVNNISNEQHVLKEPIFPSNTTQYTSLNKSYGYNTLGQPVEMLPADAYYTRIPSLPQTLSPHSEIKPQSYAPKYSNVKSTISKTSLFPIKTIGKTPSRSQLHRLYNNYKGSQSFTQQNVKDFTRSRETNSDRMLHVSQINPNIREEIPLEKIGGDTARNNAIPRQPYKLGQGMGIGDVPSPNETVNSALTEKIEQPASRKGRNGLQDVAFTSYPTSAAWSFHGNTATPPPPRYRYRSKI